MYFLSCVDRIVGGRERHRQRQREREHLVEGTKQLQTSLMLSRSPLVLFVRLDGTALYITFKIEHSKYQGITDNLASQ